MQMLPEVEPMEGRTRKKKQFPKFLIPGIQGRLCRGHFPVLSFQNL